MRLHTNRSSSFRTSGTLSGTSGRPPFPAAGVAPANGSPPPPPPPTSSASHAGASRSNSAPHTRLNRTPPWPTPDTPPHATDSRPLESTRHAESTPDPARNTRHARPVDRDADAPPATTANPSHPPGQTDAPPRHTRAVLSSRPRRWPAATPRTETRTNVRRRRQPPGEGKRANRLEELQSQGDIRETGDASRS
jgi:hypothetical protein